MQQALKILLVGMLIAIGVLIFVTFFLGGTTQNLTNVIYELERCERVGILMVIPQEKLPFEIQDALKEDKKGRFFSVLQTIYISMIDGKTIPADGQWGLLYAHKDDFAYEYRTDEGKYKKEEWRFGTKLEAVGILGQGFMPTIGAQETGTKFYLNITGLRGVSDTGFEVGQIINNPDYNSNFRPESGSLDIWQKSSCMFRMVTHNGFRDAQCMEYGFLPDPNWQRVGPKVVGNGIFGVDACTNGMWINPINDMTGISTLYTTNPEATSAVDRALAYFRQVFQAPVVP